MPETVTRRQKVKTAQPAKVLKQVSSDNKTETVNQDTDKTTITTKTKTTIRSSVISETKIKKVLDEERINKDVISVIKTIKSAIENNKEIKKELSDKDLDVVGEYINKYKNKLYKEEKEGKKPSTNEISLRAFMNQKYKFKKDLSTYFGIICDLMVEEIVTASMEHVVSIDKKLINKTHIVRSQLSDKLLYPLYCNLPSFVSQTNENSQTTPTETTEETTTETTEEVVSKVNKYFMGNVKTVFNNLRGDNEKRLKIQKKYQEFLSKLIVEFLDRIIHPLLVTVNNNSRNRVVVQNTASSVIEIFMSDFSWEHNRYPELWTAIQQRWKH